jgi:3-oxoacyl-[acyl-carrier-protein] synthase III
MRFTDTHVLSVAHAEAPEVVTSAWIDQQLAATYERVGVRPGLLADLAGIAERRWWPEGMTFDEAAAIAGRAAIEAAGVAVDEIDLMISTSVCKHHLEPSVACAVHDRLGLAATCRNFDLGNACLGFINGMDVAAMAIDAGHARNVLIVDGEGSRQTQQLTLERLASPDATAADVFENFATLTLGSGAAAMVMGAPRAGGHAFTGSVSRAATQHNDICVGGLDGMRTDTAALLAAGLVLAADTVAAIDAEGWDWRDSDVFVTHQISSVHTAKMCELMDIDPALVPLTYPTLGNIGPAAVPYTLSVVADGLSSGDQVLLCGIGSGLNCSIAELIW